ncbi:MAG: aminotransferase class I/II-fold pyridoxal phosphate-dependent enzyme, partial [Deltaproteobacteria bacterium]
MAGADEIARSELDALRARGLLRSLEPLRTPPGAEVELRPGERLINFSSNDYLGLASDPRIAEALAGGARTWGAGAGASRLVCGDFLPQHELEAQLARFEGTEAAVLFGSGYAANCGLLASLAGPEDLILSDALNHASIVDGCRLSRARIEICPHGNVGAVARLLRSPARRKL